MFAVGSVILLVLTIVALQEYFDQIWNEAVYEKVLAAPSEQLKDLRNRDDWNLTHYMYSDKKTGVVRIPMDKADGVVRDGSRGGKDVLSGEAYATEDGRAATRRLRGATLRQRMQPEAGKRRSAVKK